jgi:hypothetical protein
MLRRISLNAAGTTSVDRRGAVIMPPTTGAAIRRMISEPVPVPHINRKKPCNDDRDGHRNGSDAQGGSFDDSINQVPIAPASPI